MAVARLIPSALADSARITTLSTGTKVIHSPTRDASERPRQATKLIRSGEVTAWLLATAACRWSSYGRRPPTAGSRSDAYSCGDRRARTLARSYNRVSYALVCFPVLALLKPSKLIGHRLRSWDLQEEALLCVIRVDEDGGSVADDGAHGLPLFVATKALAVQASYCRATGWLSPGCGCCADRA